MLLINPVKLKNLFSDHRYDDFPSLMWDHFTIESDSCIYNERTEWSYLVLHNSVSWGELMSCFAFDEEKKEFYVYEELG